ncbi:unnamed protein product [Ectocarpus sp. 12 AP-2014]
MSSCTKHQYRRSSETKNILHPSLVEPPMMDCLFVKKIGENLSKKEAFPQEHQKQVTPTNEYSRCLLQCPRLPLTRIQPLSISCFPATTCESTCHYRHRRGGCGKMRIPAAKSSNAAAACVEPWKNRRRVLVALRTLRTE